MWLLPAAMAVSLLAQQVYYTHSRESVEECGGQGTILCCDAPSTCMVHGQSTAAPPFLRCLSEWPVYVTCAGPHLQGCFQHHHQLGTRGWRRWGQLCEKVCACLRPSSMAKVGPA